MRSQHRRHGCVASSSDVATASIDRDGGNGFGKVLDDRNLDCRA